MASFEEGLLEYQRVSFETMKFGSIILRTGVKNELVIDKKKTSSERPPIPYKFSFKNLFTMIVIKIELIKTARQALNPKLACSAVYVEFL